MVKMKMKSKRLFMGLGLMIVVMLILGIGIGIAASGSDGRFVVLGETQSGIFGVTVSTVTPSTDELLGKYETDNRSFTKYVFNDTIVYEHSRKNHVYNYTIRTGSYPQIIHAKSKPVTGGMINCTKFTDANGKTYEDWIPAIRLWKE